MSLRKKVLEAGNDHHLIAKEQFGQEESKWTTKTCAVVRICAHNDGGRGVMIGGGGGGGGGDTAYQKQQYTILPFCTHTRMHTHIHTHTHTHTYTHTHTHTHTYTHIHTCTLFISCTACISDLHLPVPNLFLPGSHRYMYNGRYW